MLPDIAQDFGGAEVYVPVNFNRRFNGPVRLRVALASSLNVPAVYTLQRLGVQAFTDFLISLGFASLESQRETLGVGLALGNAEVSLWELARGFAVFPRGGVPLEARDVLARAQRRSGGRRGGGGPRGGRGCRSPRSRRRSRPALASSAPTPPPRSAASSPTSEAAFSGSAPRER